jgi:CheY-like chemotaxis protein
MPPDEAVPTGPEVAEALRRAMWDCDVVVTDVSIPGSSGRELARHNQQHRPELPIVLMFGMDMEETDEGRTAALLKPFTIEELERTIQCLG